MAQIDTALDKNQCYNKYITMQCYVFVTLGVDKNINSLYNYNRKEYKL